MKFAKPLLVIGASVAISRLAIALPALEFINSFRGAAPNKSPGSDNSASGADGSLR